MSDFMSFSVKIFGTLHVCFQLSFLIQEVFSLFILSSPKSSTFLGLVSQLLWFFSLSLYAFLSLLIFSSANVNPRFGSASMTPPFLHPACRHCPLCFLELMALTEGLRLQLLHCSFILPPLYSQSQVKLLHFKASGQVRIWVKPSSLTFLHWCMGRFRLCHSTCDYLCLLFVDSLSDFDI